MVRTYDENDKERERKSQELGSKEKYLFLFSFLGHFPCSWVALLIHGTLTRRRVGMMLVAMLTVERFSGAREKRLLSTQLASILLKGAQWGINRIDALVNAVGQHCHRLPAALKVYRAVELGSSCCSPPSLPLSRPFLSIADLVYVDKRALTCTTCKFYLRSQDTRKLPPQMLLWIVGIPASSINISALQAK